MNRTTAAERKIMVAATNVEDARLIAQILREDFDHVETTSDPDLAVRDFETFQPQILVLAFKVLEESERFYLGLYRRSDLAQAIAHRTLVFCQRKDAFRAFELCRKQHFDDYVIFWPVNYDPHRVRMAALLAARAGLVECEGPSPMQFATQTRHIAELESLLQTSIARGGAHIRQVGDSLREMEANIGDVIEGFSRRWIDGERNRVMDATGRGGLERELALLHDDAVHRPFAGVNALLEPVQRWVEIFKEELAPQLEAARALVDLAAQVRPLILVVDDDEFQHRLLGQMLSEVPVDVAFASSGAEALAMLRTQRPDLILMDFHLLDTSGVEVTRRLKSTPLTAEIPVILITGNSTREVLLESHRAGAVDFMVKPFDRSRLLAGIARHLPGAGDLLTLITEQVSGSGSLRIFSDE